MARTRIRVGVLGAGGMGSRHAHNLASSVPQAEVVAVADIDRSRAAAVAEACGGARVYVDPLKAIRDGDVDAVVIASPDPTHAELALACIEAGKPALCEKPLGWTVAEAKQVALAEARAGSRLIQVGFMREYDRPHVELKAAIGDGRIGRPLLFKGTHRVSRSGTAAAERDPKQVDKAVNMARAAAVHDIHSLRWLMSTEISSVLVSSIPALEEVPESSRLIVLHLGLANGGLATIEMNSDAGYGYEVAAEVVGERGSATALTPAHLSLRAGDSCSRTFEQHWLDRFADAYVEEARAWIGSLLDHRPVGPNAWDGYMATLVTEACVASLAGKAIVPVPAEERPTIYDRSH